MFTIGADVKSPVVAYIMEGGKTVDRLPRK